MKPIPTIFLAAALLSLIGCSSSSTPTVTPPKTVTVQVLDFSYNPKQVQINSGDTVRWELVGATTTHTVTALNAAFDSGFIFLQPGDFYDRTFNQDNVTFEYSCDTHEAAPLDMKGSVLVGSGAPPPLIGY